MSGRTGDGFTGRVSALLDIPPGTWRWLLPLAAAIAAVTAWFTFPIGLHPDDYREALAARSVSWAGLWSFEAAPNPLHLSVWKLALREAAAPPAGVLRSVAAAIHVLNAILVYSVLRELFSRPWRIAAGVMFLVYRGGNSVLFWAPTVKDALMLHFSLLALLLWRTGTPGNRRQYWALLPATLAMLAKPTAVLLAPMLILHELLVETGLTGKERLGRRLKPLGVLSGTLAALAVLALLKPGIWSGHTLLGNRPGIEGLAAYLFGSLLQFTTWTALPAGPLEGFFARPWVSGAGLFLFAGLAAGLVFLDNRFRWGSLWYLGFILLPMNANGGTPAPHYAYGAAFGLLTALLAGGERLARTSRNGTAAVAALAAVWTGLNCFWWSSDFRYFRAAGKAGLDIHHQVSLHRDEILSAGGIYRTGSVPQFPALMVQPDLLEFETGRRLPVFHPEGDACPEDNRYPCLSSIATVREALACVDSPAGGCLIWVSARPGNP